MSSSCDDSSRRIRDSRSRARSGNDRCVRTYCSQSRTGTPHHRFHSGDERLPRLALLHQDAPSFWHEPVETSPPLAWLLDPAALDPAAVLEAEQCGVERGEGEGQLPARARLNQFPDLVAMAGTGLEQRQDEHLAAALLELGAEHC